MKCENYWFKYIGLERKRFRNRLKTEKIECENQATQIVHQDSEYPHLDKDMNVCDACADQITMVNWLHKAAREGTLFDD